MTTNAAHPTTSERVRAWVAWQLSRLPGQCWADLVMWSLNWTPTDTLYWWPWRPIKPLCRRDLDRTGCCYCGKLTRPSRAHTDPAGGIER